MKYVKIRVTSVDCPKRFYRVMYVRKDLSLEGLGVAILSSLRCEFEHMFMFEDKSRHYVDESWLEDSLPFIEEVDYTKHTLQDINYYADKTFRLVYDTGDYWVFKIKVYEEEKELDEEYLGINIDAKGDRIWEDYRSEFLNYINGEKVEDRPWNIPENKTIESFDDKIDIEDLNNETVMMMDDE